MECNEIWLPIKGYEGLYEISNMGRVKSLCYWGKQKVRILETNAKERKYVKVALRKEGRMQYYRVHRLVAQAFLPPPTEEQTQVDHIDGNPHNNFVRCEQMGGYIIVYSEGTNLRWATPKENMANENTRRQIKLSRANITNETRERMSRGQKKRFKRERDTKTGRYQTFL